MAIRFIDGWEGNPVRDPFDVLIQTLNLINGLLNNFENRLDEYEKYIRIYLERIHLDQSLMVSAACLAIRDLDEWPQNGWAIYYPTPSSFIAKGEQYFKVNQTLMLKEYAHAVAQSFEAFETFLRDLLATFFRLNIRFVDKAKIFEFDNHLKTKDRRPSDTDYWRGFIDRFYPQNTHVLKAIHNIAPEIKRIENTNNRGIDLKEWFSLVTEVRHATIHSKGTIKPYRIQNLKASVNEHLLSTYAPGLKTNSGYQVEMSKEATHENLTLFAEYSYIIFKHLSKIAGYTCEINSFVTESTG
ncbi:hypothetical protein [Dehalogenimonas etheniformans]|uniref:RiboL-PSP-HEPN domain-containing protein n=1 Tax=Dehalogenimonas etheniformans TaxID=1536648 RepID=A0A2P5PA32_9CHLR|nr:hypothetical protein [Dehalogenimonas etheniformans]PPD59152.1 hypothetical protein JP09_000280 [Dehalogenimonas etheniformans]QNT75805.1 hypothetical protein HX448_03430 [Dehalogenimonas etheniformans]